MPTDKQIREMADQGYIWVDMWPRGYWATAYSFGTGK